MGKDDPTLDLQIADVTMANSIDWNQIRKAHMIDPIMVRLAHVIQRGWPVIGGVFTNVRCGLYTTGGYRL